ncbi:aldo/keto reductase [Actinomyces sp. Z5]|uniref:aldo/keto reductase n=1 Tax=Actinomyces sp. Z5 TaxID=2250216 RepID=UPI000DCD28BE|nr:aldo/keto reductase [Actinomyces sp. Z5]RAX23515.1 aldo/keto reductase [Actinomyces sp. Z5]
MSTALPAKALTLRQGTSGAEPVAIPQLGFGTYKVTGPDAERAVTAALAVGYRHIDTAQMYGNEAGVGRALAASGIPREQLWITSKLNNPNHRRDDALRSFDATMADLGLDVLDLFLVHWPLAASPGIDLVDTWRTMIEILNSGRVRAIGVSNYQPEHLHTIIDATGVTPAVNQIELHPYLNQTELRAVDDELGIITESWSPLGRGRVLDDPELARLAAEMDVTPAQVIIRWHLQHGLVVIPKTTHPERMRANADVFGFELTDAQMAAVDALDRGLRTGSHPDRVQI